MSEENFDEYETIVPDVTISFENLEKYFFDENWKIREKCYEFLFE